MKKFLAVIFVIAAIFCISGCNVTTELIVKEDGTVTMAKAPEMYADYSDINAAYKSMFDDTEDIDPLAIPVLLQSARIDYSIKTTDGKTSYQLMLGDRIDLSDPTLGSVSENGSRITATTFYLSLADEKEDLNSADIGEFEELGFDRNTINDIIGNTTIKYIVTMPKEIVFTNGKLSKDKKTVTFDLSPKSIENATSDFYAYTKDAKDIITLGNVDGKYATGKKVEISTPDKIKKITVNGKKISKNYFSTKKDGKYEVVVTTKNSKLNQTVIKDSTAPTVKGVKNGETYKKTVTIKFSDATSGIKSAKLNGKTIKSGKKVKSAGTYTLVVTDKAGNKSTIKFTIKK